MIKIDAECRMALHATLDAVIEQIRNDDLYISFELNPIEFKIVANRLCKGTNSEWDIYESYEDVFTTTNALGLIDRLDKFSETKQETDTTED